MADWDKIFSPIVMAKLTYGENVEEFNGRDEKILTANQVAARFRKYLKDNYEPPKKKKHNESNKTN